jgi:hypothetical protein
MTLSKQTPEAVDVELKVPVATICYLIEKAREFDVKVGTSDPTSERVDDDDVDAAVLEDRPSDPVETEMRSVIDDLNDSAQVDLVAVMWLGRGDGPDDFSEAREMAGDAHNERTADYLLGTPMLSDYLEEGMAALGLDCSDWSETRV